MQTFAGQAVLAIENARLFQEARQARTAAEATRRPAPSPGPTGAIRKKGLARPTHRRHRSRDQSAAVCRYLNNLKVP
jgi:hypothetical protein